MNTKLKSVVVAGVDGSPESLVAAQWAAREAERRHQSLLLVHAFTEPIIGYQPGVALPTGLADGMRRASLRLLHAAAGEVRSAHPDLEVQLKSVHGEPRRSLRSASENAFLTVVGTRGRGRISEVAMGSVALYVAAHARSPVAVIPPTIDIGGADPARPVLLGADGTENSEAAVGYAFDEAAVRSADLLAVTVWDDPALRGFAMAAPLVGILEDQEEEVVLAEQLAGWAEKYPDVRVREVVLRGRAAGQLLACRENGRQPALIVVGSRGRGGVAGLVLGSTSQRLIAAAQLPVVVVRHQRHD